MQVDRCERLGWLGWTVWLSQLDRLHWFKWFNHPKTVLGTSSWAPGPDSVLEDDIMHAQHETDLSRIVASHIFRDPATTHPLCESHTTRDNTRKVGCRLINRYTAVILASGSELHIVGMILDL